MKRLVDIFLSSAMLVLLSPIMAIVAIAVRIDLGAPVLFRQVRPGLKGQPFTLYKFRTMRGAHSGELAPDRDEERLTAFGRRLRASSLDELPQLINVLKGEMSLVGPRPLPADDGDYLGDVRRRLLVRPGITGLWQVSGRSDLSWDEAVRLDLYYVDNWSLTYDLGILWRTIWVVLKRKGAY